MHISNLVDKVYNMLNQLVSPSYCSNLHPFPLPPPLSTYIAFILTHHDEGPEDNVSCLAKQRWNLLVR